MEDTTGVEAHQGRGRVSWTRRLDRDGGHQGRGRVSGRRRRLTD